MPSEPASDDLDLDAIEELCAAATPGPWFVRNLDDDHAMNLVGVGTVEDTGRGENAAFIAMAREAVPRLVAEVRRLRWLVEFGACHTAGTTGTEFVLPLDDEMLAYFREMTDVLVEHIGISRAEAVARINAAYGTRQWVALDLQLMGHELPEYWAYAVYYAPDSRHRLPIGDPTADADIDFSTHPVRPAPPKDSPFWTL
ncbi:hypothetical protein ACH4GM_13345 [Streptomyces coeruleorubidus]|uniref:hypothetical protein n=1 Tax=Streptomyces coeruleorubidus TaxID=116188 RepID=UPI00378E9B02